MPGMSIEQIVPERLADVFDLGLHAADAGIVDQDINLAERLLGGRDRRFHLGNDPVVGLQTQNLDPVLFEFRLRTVDVFLFKIGDCDRGAALRQHAGMRLPEPAAPTRD
jgi:hypothetical protein